MDEEDIRKLLPIERYKHFKGIYIEETKEYFLCDFYEIQQAEKGIIYRVQVEYKEQKQFAEFEPDSQGVWQLTKGTISSVLAKELIYNIATVCTKK